MDVQTRYGICKNVDLDHLKEYHGKGCYLFTNYIVDNNNGSYLLFGFEIWENEEDENKKFHFFEEEWFEDGSSDMYPAEISTFDRDYIKNLYYEFIKNK